MNKIEFINNYNRINKNDYKGIRGKITLVGGSYGMAGALGLNIIGAVSAGSTYTNVLCEEKVYEIIGSKFLNCVFFPINKDNYENQLKNIYSSKAVCFGSGMNNLPYASDVLDALLLNYNYNLVLDAHSFNILQNNYYKLSFSKANIILTPHIKELSTLTSTSIGDIRNNKSFCKNFAKNNKVFLILKDTSITIYTPNGEIYENNLGRENLARAGSGDLLTGIITHFLTQHNDTYTALKMAVWLFTNISKIAAEKYSISSFNLEKYSELIDAFYFENKL